MKEVSQQKHVLEIISALATPVPRKITSVEESKLQASQGLIAETDYK